MGNKYRRKSPTLQCGVFSFVIQSNFGEVIYDAISLSLICFHGSAPLYLLLADFEGDFTLFQKKPIK
jgi:hypothetical protein